MILINRAGVYVKNVALPMLICCYLAGTLSAQQSNTAAASGAQLSETLKIIPLVGQDQVNNLRVPVPVDLVVEIRDQNDRPLEGAMVHFQLPLMGASGSFEGGVRDKQVTSNLQGQATVTYTPNTEHGRFTIQVRATLGGQAGMANIPQQNLAENEPGQKSWFSRHKTLMILIAVGAAGGVIAGVLASGGSSSTTSGSTGTTTTITITPGIPTVSGPH